MSIQYYQDNAQSFFNSTVNVDMSDLHTRFLQYLPQGALILDAGCGSGRDSRTFLDAGFDVIAMDASQEMVKLASQHTGLDVLHRTFNQVTEVDTYDAIWTCASLLHVPQKELQQAMKSLKRSLKPQGIWYLSFKYGSGERIKDGRHFTDMNEFKLETLINSLDGLNIAEQWITEDVRPERSETWLNCILINNSASLSS